MRHSPIFIHSLFRSGSTYLFEVFRRSPQGFRCYQEALHETVAQCRHDPSPLLGDLASQAEELRHGDMEKPHFYELYRAWPTWRDTAREEEVYTGYFRSADDTDGLALWRSLLDLDGRRVVFQECRTTGRIAQLKTQLGGYHIYLWRRPREQWRSYGIDRYFSIVNRMIINAPGAPEALRKLLDRIPGSRTQIGDVQAAINFLYQTEPGDEQDYRLFYTLWCLGMIAGLEHADLMLSIDGLSYVGAYREEITHELERAGIAGLDFSGAAIPQRPLASAQQVAMFSSVESEVRQALGLQASLAPYLDKLVDLEIAASAFSPAGDPIPVA